ncbi:MAG: asparaginase [Gemmatimonadetes bacterium]|nr:asparaginase [Gemmatimonadota bacterium]NNL30701.1 asparaginase [Gemmatimonadota bacterium]
MAVPRGMTGAAVLAAVIAPMLACAVDVTGQGLPRVHVIATGGTIAGRATGGQLTGAQIVEAVPGLADVAAIEVEEFSRVGSSAMTPDHWLRLARRVNGLFAADPGLAGIVVTHGTDTMEETGYFLHLTVEDSRPVVMVGSMRNSSAVSADGPANLLSAMRVATHPGAIGVGTLVVLNDEIHSARDVRKRDSNRVDTFGSEWGPLGVVDSDTIVFRHGVRTRHTTTSAVRLSDSVTELPFVPIVADFTGNEGAVLDDWVEAGARGVAVQAFGGGRGSPGMRRAVADAAEAGVRVVLASRVPEGRVLSGGASPSQGVVTAGDLPPHKARILLMLALTEDRTGAELQRLFDTH